MDIAAIQALGTQKERKQSQVSGGTIPRGRAGDGAAVCDPRMEEIALPLVWGCRHTAQLGGTLV